jgi:adenylate cyclase
MRRRIGFGEPPGYRIIEEMKEAGHTDYILFVHRFAAEGTIGEMDCFYSAWSTFHPEGFSDPDIRALRRLIPALGLAAKSASLARIASRPSSGFPTSGRSPPSPTRPGRTRSSPS